MTVPSSVRPSLVAPNQRQSELLRRNEQLSPTLRRDLDEALWPVWPAISPRFSHEADTHNLLLRAASLQRHQLARASVQGQIGAARLVALRQEATLAAWQLDAIEVGALTKMGQIDAALQILANLSAEDVPWAAASHEKRGARPGRQLVGQHLFWLLAHVAIEHPAGTPVLAKLLGLGLQEQLHKEPEMTDWLLLNALGQGHHHALAPLLQAGARPSPQGRALLQGQLDALAHDLAKLPRPARSLDAAQRAALTTLADKAAMLGLLPEQLLALTEAPAMPARRGLRWLRALGARATAPGVQAPPDTLGVQLRRG